MAPNIHHYTASFGTRNHDFVISSSQVHSYYVNNHFYYPPHQHSNYFDWIYVEKGERHEIINGKSFILSPGDLVWIRQNDWHEGEGDRLKFFNLCGKTEWLESVMAFMQTMEAYQALLKLPDPPICNIPAAQRPALNKTWQYCWDIQANDSGPCYAIKIVSMLFVDYFLPKVKRIKKEKRFPDWFRMAMSYIHSHIGKPISSEQLAAACNKSPEHIARSFRTYLNVTPSQYINRTRLNYAARLLTTTDLSILAISMEAGFESLGYFYELFKKRFNDSPHAYRLSSRNAVKI